jgi:hypothetical protein
VWNPTTGKYEGSPTRCADLYVFCHYPEQDRCRANVLDVGAWDFYVLSTDRLDEVFGNAKSVSLNGIRKVCPRCKFDALKSTVDRALEASDANALLTSQR